jgi:Flp pilus assembly protein TadD
MALIERRRDRYGISKMRTHCILLFILILIAGAASVASQEVNPQVQQPPGLADFIEARIHEARGEFREALAAYDRALTAQPEVIEIRVRYASLLTEIGLAERAIEVLEGAGDLDWYGKRVWALALARHSGRNPGFLEDAEAALRSALEERNDDPNLELSMAQVLHRLGKVEEAEELVSEIRALRGGSPQLAAYHAGLLMELDRQQEAANLYAECAGAGFEVGEECRQQLIQLLVTFGRPGEAGEIILRSLDDEDLDEMMRAATLLYEGERHEEALRTVQRVLREASDSPRARTLEAYLLASLGRHREAITAFRSLLRRDRDNLDLLLALAWSTANIGDMDEARRWVERAWTEVEENGEVEQEARVALTGARVELVGDFSARAREWLARVTSHEDVGDQAVFLLAETYRRDEMWNEGIASMLRLQPRLQGSARKAAVAFEAEFRSRTGDSRATRMLRPLLDSDSSRDVLLGLQVLQELELWAEVDLEAAAAIERFVDDRRFKFTRAAALERLGRLDEAEALFLELVDSDPNDAAAANYLGYSWADRGENLSEALDLVSRAVAIEPENPAYLDSLGWVHYRLGDLDQAEYWLRRAVGFGGGDGTILAHLGEVLLEKGNSDEAQSLLRRALDVGCENPEYVRELLDRQGAQR